MKEFMLNPPDRLSVTRIVTVTFRPAGSDETNSPRISSPRPPGIGGRGASDTQRKDSRPSVSPTPFSFDNVIENSSPIERSAALHLTKIAMVNLHPLVRSHVAIEARHFNSRSKKCGFSTFGETAADKPPLAQLAIISSKQTVNQARPAVSNAIWYSGSVKKAATESIDNDGQPASYRRILVTA
jgi:hypothetical protein